MTRSSPGGFRSPTRASTRRCRPTPTFSASGSAPSRPAWAKASAQGPDGAGARRRRRCRPGGGERCRGGGGPQDRRRRRQTRARRNPNRERGGPIVGNPIGREALLSELKYEMISYSPEELIELAQTELAWCEDEMKKAAREMGQGDDWRAALEHVKTHVRRAWQAAGLDPRPGPRGDRIPRRPRPGDRARSSAATHGGWP